MRIRRDIGGTLLPTALGAVAVALFLFGLVGFSDAQSQPKPQPTPKPAKTPHLFDELQIRNSTTEDAAPATAPAAAAPAFPFPALEHAQRAGATACLGALGQTLQRAIDAPHEAHSLWSVDKPNQHDFVSIAGLRYANAIAPRGVVVSSTGPSAASGCDSTSVQILPSSRSCATIRSSLGAGVKAIGKISDLTLVELPDGMRIVLLPTAGDGCALVGVNVAFGK